MEYLFRNLLELYLGTFIRFVYLRYIREGKIDKDNELDIFTNEMANRSYGCIFLIIIVGILAYFLT